eukprot:scaffold4140_cov178-Ochromonas_danica.AAC.15
MGCHCCKATKEDGECEIELSNVTNSNLICKIGLKGERVKTVVREDNTIDVSGSGICLGSCSLDGDVGRWEVVVSKGVQEVAVGLLRARKNQLPDLSKSLSDYKDHETSQAWLLDPSFLKEGDVVGVYYDQTDMPMVTFTINHEIVAAATIHRIRPSNDIYPAVSVSGQGQVKVIFDESAFRYPSLSPKFRMVLSSTSLL